VSLPLGVSSGIAESSVWLNPVRRENSIVPLDGFGTHRLVERSPCLYLVH